MPRKIFIRRVKENTPKTPNSPVKATNHPSQSREKGCTRPRNHRNRMQTKKLNKNLPVYPLYGPGHDMNLCKVIQAQSKAIKPTWSTASGGRAGHMRFQATNKYPSGVQDTNDLVANTVKEVLKAKKRAKATAAQDSRWEEDPGKINYKKLSTGRE